MRLNETVSAGEEDLAAELHGLKPPDSIALVRNDLRLPDKADGHEAHQENTNGEGKVCVGLASR
jgi:hypothetical protein